MKNRKITLSELKRHLITMIDYNLKTIKISGYGVVSKEELTEIIDSYARKDRFKNIAVYDENQDMSEMMVARIDKTTLSYIVMMDTDRGYDSSWEFKVILN